MGTSFVPGYEQTLASPHGRCSALSKDDGPVHKWQHKPGGRMVLKGAYRSNRPPTKGAQRRPIHAALWKIKRGPLRNGAEE